MISDKVKEFANSKNEDIGYIVFEIKQKVNQDRDIDAVCIVEGKDDEIFYKGIIHKFLPEKYPKYAIGIYSAGGKKRVLSILDYLEKHPSRYNEYYIVDCDYDGCDVTNDKLFITDGYSFESFNFYEDNIKYIFKYYFIDKIENILIKWNEVFSKYLELILLYCAWKKEIVGLKIKTEEYKNCDKPIIDKITSTRLKNSSIKSNLSYNLNYLNNLIPSIYKISESKINSNIEFFKKNPAYIETKTMLLHILIEFINTYSNKLIDKNIFFKDLEKIKHDYKINFQQ